MTLHTSYFGNINKIRQEDQEPPVFVSIAGKTPSWFDGPRMPELAPKKEWWTEWHERFKDSLESSESVTWYTKKYKETVLGCLDQVSVVTKLGSSVRTLFFSAMRHQRSSATATWCLSG